MTTTIENAPGTCGMIFPRHPDDERRPRQDDPCLRPAIGATEDGVRVCEECAAAMARERFRMDRDAPTPLPCFVIALGLSCAYFVNVDAKHGGYLKDALVFEHRSAAENYINFPWMASFRPCHVVETTRQKIDENRAMHASVSSEGVL